MKHQMFQPYDQGLLQCPQRPGLIMDRRWKPSSAAEPAPRCPRCDSSNTKFCYYNNYSLTQPRYFCKGCRRYWTKGGSLRNIPVGGGCRKNRRPKSARLPSSGQNHARESSVKSDGTAESSTLSGSSTEAAATSDGSTIDLAAVYAKFLNQHPTDDQDGHISTMAQMSDQLGSKPNYGSSLPPSVDFRLIGSSIANINNKVISSFQSEPISHFEPDSACYAIGQSTATLGVDSFWATNYDQVDTDFNWQSTLLEQPLVDDHLNLQSNYFNSNWTTTPFDLSQL